jgi:hypothetical protein
MKREVWWLPEAKTRLAEIWISSEAGIQRAITEQVDVFEQACLRNPDNVGESRGPLARVWTSGYLGIEFNIFLDGKLIRVTRVWTIRRSREG